MDFFKPEDFYFSDEMVKRDVYGYATKAAQLANEKLKRDSVAVYGKVVKDSFGTEAEKYISWTYKNRTDFPAELWARIICIESSKCEHLNKDIILVQAPAIHEGRWYQCKCGAKMEPSGFREIK